MPKDLGNHRTKKIIPFMPFTLGRPSTSVPDLVGATILDFGTFVRSNVEGGGLVIDFEKDGVKRRVVFAFTELGMYVDSIGVLDA